MEKEARLQAIYDTISKSEVPVSGTALSKNLMYQDKSLCKTLPY